MPVLHYDVETRSKADLKVVGTHAYAADPSTEVLCLAYAVDDEPVQLWTPGDQVSAEFAEAASNPNWTVVAHNDQFERLIAHHILEPRYGFPTIPIERRRCSMAMALAAALPGKLEKATEALDLPEKKDPRGARLIRLLSKPRPDGTFNNDPELLRQLYEYCRQDVRAERGLYCALPPLIAQEQAIWQLDAVINARGFYTDGNLLHASHQVVIETEAKSQSEFRELTGLDSTNQTQKFVAWLAAAGCIVTDVQKGTLRHALRRKELGDEVRRAIELRLELAHASAAKVEALQAWRGADGRVRGTLQFHGAATGRWVGRGPQPQNFKRDGSDINAKITAVMNGGAGLASPVEAVGDIARAMITAAPGHGLKIGDFSGIESRALAWASRQQSKLDQWKRFDETGDPNDDPYVLIGRSIGHPEATARAYGKIADLAFGYQGGVGAWQNFGPDDDTSSEAQIKIYRDTWRRQHPATERFWYALDRAAVRAVASPATDQRADRFLFRYDRPFLRVSLPSGRSLSYPFPRLETGKYGSPRVTFLDNSSGKFVDCRFGNGAYGGLWTENIVSAIARDLLAAALTRLEAAGYLPILHVHDEIVCEVLDGFGSLDEFKRILCEVPAWADGLPIAAKVRDGLRFAKAENEGVPQSLTPAENAPAANCGASFVRTELESTAAPPPNGTPWDDPLADIYADAGTAGLQWSTPIIEEVSPVLASLSEEDRAIVRPAAAGNGHDQDQRHDGNRRTDNGYDGTRGNYSGHHSEAPADEPFAPIHNRLLRKGYVPAQDFPYDLPGGKSLYYERRYELKPGITATKKQPRKTIRYYRVKDGIHLNGTGPRRIIYNWPAIMNAGPGASVFVTEGANKSKPINDKGLLATATPYHVWPPECVAALAGQHLFYLEDHDFDDTEGRNAGREHSAKANAANTATAASFRIIPTAHLWKYLPPGTRGLKHGDDVKDWLELGGDAAKLIEICREIPSKPKIESVRASDIKPTTVKWLWPGRFALGKLGIIAGLPDEGKGLLFYYIIARITRGRPWPCGEGTAPLGNVILLTAEDDLQDTVIPRLIAAGADRARVEILRMVPNGNGKRMFSLVTDLEMLRQKIEEVGHVQAIFIDPITAYLGIKQIDSFRTTDVRAVLAPMVDLAIERKVLILAIMHFNKKIDVMNVLLRISDSLAFGATSRHCYAVVNDAENKRSLMVKGKNNLAPKDQKALAFTIDIGDGGIDEKTSAAIQAPYITFAPDPVDVTASEAMQAAAESQSPSARDSAKHFLTTLLSNGPMGSKEVLEAAKANGISFRTLYRAKDELGVEIKKDGPLNEKGERTWQWHPLAKG